MAYDPGALEAALAAAVGDEPNLIAELRSAFFASAALHTEALAQAASIEDWHGAASRLHSLAASFGALRLMDVATEATRATYPDAGLLRRIRRTIAAFDL